MILLKTSHSASEGDLRDDRTVEYRPCPQPGGTRTGPAGDLGPVPDGPESGFNGIGGAWVNPVLGGIVEGAPRNLLSIDGFREVNPLVVRVPSVMSKCPSVR